MMQNPFCIILLYDITANFVVCGVLGWSIWEGGVETVAGWRGVILVLCFVSAFGSVGAVLELASGLLHIRRIRRNFEELRVAMSDEQRAEMRTGPTVPFAIALYGLTGAAAAYLAVVLYRVGG